MVIQKRQILWDWTNSAGPGNPGVPDKINQVPFGPNSPVASVNNWNAWVPPELKGRAPFRPMVRVLASTQGNDWAMIQNTPFPIVLFFNEPERQGISPDQAADLWHRLMVPLRKNKGKKLGSPAVASDAAGRKWIGRFMTLVKDNPPDFLCLHHYSNKADQAIKYITDMHNTWPKRKIMVTEIACIDRNYRNVLQYTVKVCNWMDQQPWIFEYGLFDFQRTVADDFVSPAAQLMGPKGNFTELGNMYVHQQPMKMPAGMASMSIMSGEATEEEEDEDIEVLPDTTEFVDESAEMNMEPLLDEVDVETPENGQVGEAVQHDGETMEDEGGEVAAMAEFGALMALGPDQQAALNLHNNKRKQKGVPVLTWDPTIAKAAESYAKHLASIGKMAHSQPDQRPNQGENLAMMSANKQPMAASTKLWLAEEKNYHGQPIGQGDFGSYGHYTQCLWRSTKRLGMGWAKDSKGTIYIVGRYGPPGNYIGQKPY